MLILSSRVLAVLLLNSNRSEPAKSTKFSFDTKDRMPMSLKHSSCTVKIEWDRDEFKLILFDPVIRRRVQLS